MKFHFNLARAICHCWEISSYERDGGSSAKADRYDRTITKLITLAKKRDTPQTCGSCRHWLHKSSTDKDWGRCTNENVHEATSIIFRDIPQGHTLFAVKLVAQHCEIHTEENSFGCIYHKGCE
jgi:hypothetical protein